MSAEVGGSGQLRIFEECIAALRKNLESSSSHPLPRSFRSKSFSAHLDFCSSSMGSNPSSNSSFNSLPTVGGLRAPASRRSSLASEASGSESTDESNFILHIFKLSQEGAVTEIDEKTQKICGSLKLFLISAQANDRRLMVRAFAQKYYEGTDLKPSSPEDADEETIEASPLFLFLIEIKNALQAHPLLSFIFASESRQYFERIVFPPREVELLETHKRLRFAQLSVEFKELLEKNPAEACGKATEFSSNIAALRLNPLPTGSIEEIGASAHQVLQETTKAFSERRMFLEKLEQEAAEKLKARFFSGDLPEGIKFFETIEDIYCTELDQIQDPVKIFVWLSLDARVGVELLGALFQKNILNPDGTSYPLPRFAAVQFYTWRIGRRELQDVTWEALLEKIVTYVDDLELCSKKPEMISLLEKPMIRIFKNILNLIDEELDFREVSQVGRVIKILNLSRKFSLEKGDFFSQSDAETLSRIIIRKILEPLKRAFRITPLQNFDRIAEVLEALVWSPFFDRRGLPLSGCINMAIISDGLIDAQRSALQKCQVDFLTEDEIITGGFLGEAITQEQRVRLLLRSCQYGLNFGFSPENMLPLVVYVYGLGFMEVSGEVITKIKVQNNYMDLVIAAVACLKSQGVSESNCENIRNIFLKRFDPDINVFLSCLQQPIGDWKLETLPTVSSSVAVLAANAIQKKIEELKQVPGAEADLDKRANLLIRILTLGPEERESEKTRALLPKPARSPAASFRLLPGSSPQTSGLGSATPSTPR